MAQTYAEWRRDNSGTREDYETYLAWMADRAAQANAGSSSDPRDAEDDAAKLAAQFNAAGVKADPGLAGGVVLYATAGQAETLLGAIDARTADARAEWVDLIARALGEYNGTAQAALDRFGRALADAERVYRLRTEAQEEPQ